MISHRLTAAENTNPYNSETNSDGWYNNDPKRTVRGPLKQDLMLPENDTDKMCKYYI